VLAAVLAFALGLRLLVAVACPGMAWPDEIFQTLEQAHRLVFGYGIIPWEFRAGARSWLLPGVLAGAMQLGRLFGGIGHVRAAQAVLVLVSLIPVCVAFAWSRRRLGLAAAVAASLACAVWFETVYFSARALNEVVAAHVAVLGLYLGLGEAVGRRRLALAGAAFGLTVVLRMHLGPAVVVALVLLGGRDLARWRFLLAGVLVAVVCAGLLDLFTWSGPFSSFWLNFRYNVVEGNSAKYGVQPWHGYVTRLGSIWSWAALPVLAFAALGAFRHPVPAAFALAALLSHSALAHKEYRFIYPVVAVVVLLASQGIAEAGAVLSARAGVRPTLAACAALTVWAVLSGWRAAAFESDGSYGFTRKGESMWHQGGAGIEAMHGFGADPEVCGIALVQAHWAWTGGYTYLHRDVPIYLAGDGRLFRMIGPAFNAVLVSRELAPALSGYRIERCWDDKCMARRPGTCMSVPAPKINAVLEHFGA
jgi:phosphatidylinositol glycan class B